MSSPLVSVIIPTYNRAQVLGRAVQSVLRQTYNDFQLLIIDDGSTDNTEECIRQFSDSRIVYLRHKNQGQSAALNTGLRVAKGKYISFLDSDDEWLSKMLEKQLALFHEDKRIGCVYTYAGRVGSVKNIELVKTFYIEGDIYKEALTQGYISHMITLMTKKECFKKIGLFDTQFTVCQDDDICLRLAKEYRFGLIPEILAVIHNDSGSQVTKSPKSYADGWWKLFRKHESEVLRVCGRKTMARHYAKCGKLYLKASETRLAHKAYKKALSFDRSIFYSGMVASTRMPPFLFSVSLGLYRVLRQTWEAFRQREAK